MKIAVPYFALGLVVLGIVLFTTPTPDWGIWLVFACLFFLLESFAVEVNDRLFQSSSVMVAMTVGVVFALNTETSATFAMVLLGATGALIPADIRQKRWFQPMANFGQLVLSGAAAGLVFDLTLGRLGEPTPSDLLLVAGVSVAASLVYTTVQTLAVRKAVQVVYPYDRLQPWSHLGLLYTSQFLMGLIGGLIGASYVIADREAILVLIVGVYGIGHMSLPRHGAVVEEVAATLAGLRGVGPHSSAVA